MIAKIRKIISAPVIISVLLLRPFIITDIMLKFKRIETGSSRLKRCGMHIIAIRLTDNQELERYLFPTSEGRDTKSKYPSFPFVFHTLDFRTFIEDKTPWHWHRDFKIIEAAEGNLIIKSSRNTVNLGPGDLCFVNSSVFHSIAPANESDPDAVINIYQFLPEFISGKAGNSFDLEYVAPVVKRRDQDMLYLSAGNAAAMGIADSLLNIRHEYDSDGFGREFKIKHQIDIIYLMVLENMVSKHKQDHVTTDIMEERMQIMIAFIQRNYQTPIKLSDIAGSAMISERECFRCFQNTIGITPARFLQHYRVRMAARRLLETDESIQIISEKAGFSDISYFGRVFKEQMHVTPRQFRKNGLSISVN